MTIKNIDNLCNTNITSEFVEIFKRGYLKSEKGFFENLKSLKQLFDFYNSLTSLSAQTPFKLYQSLFSSVLFNGDK